MPGATGARARHCPAPGQLCTRISAAGVCTVPRRVSSGAAHPIPDVLCNREIKFGICLRYAQRLGGTWVCDPVHYARPGSGRGPGRSCCAGAIRPRISLIFCAAWSVPRFTQVMFPLGELTKTEVARPGTNVRGLPVYNKPDSTGICFNSAERPVHRVSHPLPARTGPGPIEKPASGQVLGTHRGLPFYTLGQRGGLEIGGIRGGSGDPWYVRAQGCGAQRPDRGGRRAIEARATAQGARTGHVNWLIDPPRTLPSAHQLRSAIPATRSERGDHLPGRRQRRQIRFAYPPQWAVTPGQTAANLQSGTFVLGGRG